MLTRSHANQFLYFKVEAWLIIFKNIKGGGGIKGTDTLLEFGKKGKSPLRNSQQFNSHFFCYIIGFVHI